MGEHASEAYGAASIKVSATPEAESYDERFQPFAPPAGSQTAFKFSQLRTNTVLIKVAHWFNW